MRTNPPSLSPYDPRRLAPSLLAAGVLAATATLGGCATIQTTAADVLLPDKDEIALGEQMSKEIEAKSKIHPDATVQKYVADLGAKIVAAAKNKRPEITYRFKVIDDPETVNAFAIPGGWIYVYTGLLLNADNEAELMAVLGHEVAHVTERHIAERLAAALGLEALVQMATGKDKSGISTLVATLIGQGYLLKFGRDHETEADEVGLAYEIRAGWNPNGFIQFFEKLKTGGIKPPVWLSSHPLPEDRIENVKKLIAAKGNVPTKDGATTYAEMKKKIAATSTTTTTTTSPPSSTTNKTSSPPAGGAGFRSGGGPL